MTSEPIGLFAGSQSNGVQERLRRAGYLSDAPSRAAILEAGLLKCLFCLDHA